MSPRLCLHLLVGIAAFFLVEPTVNAETVTLDTGIQYQTIQGWVGVVGNSSGLGTSWQTSQAINRAVNELGLTTFRMDQPFSGDSSGGANSWQLSINGTNPSNSNWASLDTLPGVTYNTTMADQVMNTWVLPLKQAVQANGSTFNLITNPSWYNSGSTGTLPSWMQYDPGAYAEVLVSFDEYLAHKYNVTPTYSTIINEAGNNNVMTPTLEASVIKAMGPMLQAAGLSTKIQLAEGVGPNVSYQYATDPSMTSQVWQYVGSISYHNYQGTATDKANLATVAAAHGVVTNEEEQAQSGAMFPEMYDDLTKGNVSYWGNYGIVGNGTGTGIQYLNAGVDGASFTLPSNYWNWWEVMHYVRPGAVRFNVTSDDSALLAMGFQQSGKPTINMYNNGTSGTKTMTLTNLPAGQYGVSYAASDVLTEVGIQTVNASGQLAVNVPQGATLTVYPYAGTNLPPEVYSYSANSSGKTYLTLGSGNTTTLTAAATDPQLYPLSYLWTLASGPSGANVTFTSQNSSTATAKGLTVAGQYVFDVAVSDGHGDTSTEQVGFNVFNGPQSPIVQATQARSPTGLGYSSLLTLPQSSVLLMNQIYYDLQGNAAVYNWSVLSEPAGASVMLASPTASNCNATNLSVAGSYTFQLVVGDGTTSAPVTQDVTVTVDPANLHAPTITNAAGSLVSPGHGHLSATTSDQDGDYITSWWNIVSQPAASNVTFDNEASPTTDFHANASGTYTFQLSTVDRTLSAQSSIITLNITVGPTAWTSTGSQAWSNSANWTDSSGLHGAPGLVGSNGYNAATFANSGMVTSIDLTGINPNIVALSFSGANYILGNGSLTLQSDSGAATVNVSGGTDSIGSFLSLVSSADVIVSGSLDRLIVSGQITGTGAVLKDGIGTLILSASNNSFSGGMVIDQGTAILNGASSLLAGSCLTIGSASEPGAVFVAPSAAGNVQISADLVPVPEPGTLALLAIGALCGILLNLEAQGWPNLLACWPRSCCSNNQVFSNRKERA